MQRGSHSGLKEEVELKFRPAQASAGPTRILELSGLLQVVLSRARGQPLHSCVQQGGDVGSGVSGNQMCVLEANCQPLGGGTPHPALEMGEVDSIHHVGVQKVGENQDDSGYTR